MTAYAKEASPGWEAVDQPEERLRTNDHVDHAGEKLLCNDRMLLHELREIVETGSLERLVIAVPADVYSAYEPTYGQHKEAEAQDEADIPCHLKNDHCEVLLPL